MAQKRDAVGQGLGSDSYKWMELKQNRLCRHEEEDSFQGFMVATGALLELVITEKQEQQQQQKQIAYFYPFLFKKFLLFDRKILSPSLMSNFLCIEGTHI